ncbi:MAG: hypothetical protein Q9220_001287 [cf. Caloplaca sp. 1 TL-2023]
MSRLVVEESFNVQAVHDILENGVWSFLVPGGSAARLQLKDYYDHLTFTGSVPRTFVGALALAGTAWPVTKVAPGVNPQFLVRAVLGFWNAFCLLYYRNAVKDVCGRSTANWFVLFQASSFHIMYYASRTLPNFLAFGLVTIALAQLLPRTSPKSSQPTSNVQKFLAITTATGIIFRSELALLLIPHTLIILLSRRLPPLAIIKSGLTGAFIGLSLTIPIDSFFWQRFPLWPELTGFIYNILHSNSSNWGISPWHFYFSSALPRLLFNPLTYGLCIPLAALQPATRNLTLTLLLPYLIFIALYSFQPHKEWRFIVYVLPPLLTAAALGANWIWNRRSKTIVYRFLSLVLVASVLASFVASTAMLAVSSLNYPGADAMNRLHALVPADSVASHELGTEAATIVKVHMDTFSCMTGITRFLQQPPPASLTQHNKGSRDEAHLHYIYDKTEDEDKLLDPVFWDQFDWVLAERPERVIGRWVVVETVDAFAGLGFVRPGEEGGGDGESGESKQQVGLGEFLGRDSKWRDAVVRLEGTGRKVTGGWWVEVRMEPRIRILRRERRVGLLGGAGGGGIGGDW